MKVGDLVKYVTDDLAIVLSRPNEGGTVKVLNDNGNTVYFVASQCEVVSASR